MFRRRVDERTEAEKKEIVYEVSVTLENLSVNIGTVRRRSLGDFRRVRGVLFRVEGITPSQWDESINSTRDVFTSPRDSV